MHVELLSNVMDPKQIDIIKIAAATEKKSAKLV